MAKAILEYNLQDIDDRHDFKLANKASDMYLVLWDVAQEIFRPYRKHGYNNSRLNDMIDQSGKTLDVDGYESTYGYEIVETLEKMFYELLEERGINLDELGN